MAEPEAGQSSDVPERDATLEARVIGHLRDVPPADELTRRRHLQAALDAFDAQGVTNPGRTGWSLRSQRVLGAVAAAAIVMIGLGVVASNGRPDPSLEVMRAVLTEEGVIEAADAPASMALSAPEGELFLAEVAGACAQVVEEELDRQARAAGALYNPSLPVIVQEATEDTLQILTAEGLEVVIDPGTCALLEPSGDAGTGSSR